MISRFGRNERGLSESVQYALVAPAVMLATLGIIEAGLWIHGQSVVARAAEAGADVARGSYGTSVEARQAAARIAAGGGLTRVDITVTGDAREVRVRVDADAPVMLQLGLRRLSETSIAPRERVTTP